MSAMKFLIITYSTRETGLFHYEDGLKLSFSCQKRFSDSISDGVVQTKFGNQSMWEMAAHLYHSVNQKFQRKIPGLQENQLDRNTHYHNKGKKNSANKVRQNKLLSPEIYSIL